MRLALFLIILSYHSVLSRSCSSSSAAAPQTIQDDRCSVTEPHPGSAVTVKDRGPLNSLLGTAKSTRDNVIDKQLPYSAIRTEISKVYNRSALSINPFLKLWVEYTQNGLYLAGFVIVVGVVFPIVIVSLWMFWECCNETSEEEGNVEHRNVTISSQLTAWTLSIIVVLLLLLLCVFVCILLVGNSWISTGVNEGGAVVQSLLPELGELKNKSLDMVQQTLVTDYEMLQLDLYRNTLDPVVLRIKEFVGNDSMATLDDYYIKVLADLMLGRSLYCHAQRVNETLGSISSPSPGFQTMISSLNQSLTELIHSCVTVVSTGDMAMNSSLFNECASFLQENRTILLPFIRDNITLLGGVNGDHTLISRMIDLLSPVNDFDAVSIQTINTLQVYLNVTLTDSLANNIRTVSERYLGTESNFSQQRSQLSADIFQFYNSSLTFGLPQSQESLEEYLGPLFLSNWEVFRYACALIFALVILLLGVCLLVAMGKGLLDMLAIYNGGDELTHSEGIHRSGTMLKKVAFSFCGVCLVSSLFFGPFLSLSGVLGRVCGPHNNFTMAFRNVVDHPDTWGKSYPFGWSLIGNSSYPLTVESVLDECRQNHSLFVSLQLSEKIDLNAVSFKDQETCYLNDMREQATNIPPFKSLSANTTTLLSLLQQVASLPVQWAELQSLTADKIFVEGFIGLKQLDNIITAMESALSHDISRAVLVGANIGTILNNNRHAIMNLSKHIDHEVVSMVTDSSRALESGQGNISATSLLSNGSDLNIIVKDAVTVTTRKELSLASQAVNSQLANFTSSSRQTLQCQTGFCFSLSSKFDQFSTSFCIDVVPGLDVFWTTLIIILALSLLILPLALVLAGQFINLELKKSMSKKFHSASSVMQQLRAIFWLALSLSVCLWFSLSVFLDHHFHEMFCLNGRPGCCAMCVGVFGALFLFLSGVVGGVSHLYQCVIIHRIAKCEPAKVKRFWIDRRKAFQFYTQLSILLLQDVPFLILSGTYANGVSPTIPISAFFTIFVSLSGIASYLVYLFQQRADILGYFLWLRKLLTDSNCYKKVKAQIDITSVDGMVSGQGNGGVPMVTNRRHMGGRYGSSESEHSDDSQGAMQREGDWHFPHIASVTSDNHRLPNIPEQPESIDVMNRGPPPALSPRSPPRLSTSPSGRGGRGLPVAYHDEDEDSFIELSQVQPTTSTVVLDNLDSVDQAALEFRREAAVQQHRGGIHVASRPVEYESSTEFGSINSLPLSELPGYFSSQLPDDQDDSSDYRDYDSDYSQVMSQQSRYSHRPNGLMGEVSMDV